MRVGYCVVDLCQGVEADFAENLVLSNLFLFESGLFLLDNDWLGDKVSYVWVVLLQHVAEIRLASGL